jgi:hypothetical protein
MKTTVISIGYEGAWERNFQTEKPGFITARGTHYVSKQ